MNILEAVQDENLFLPFLGELNTWRTWLACLRVVYGLPVPAKRYDAVQACTGRDVDLFPAEGFDTALFLTGRRSGKSRIAAIIGAFEAALAGHETKLAKGERGVVAVCAPTKPQSRIVRDYLRAIFEPPLLASEVVQETKEGFELRNGNRIQILTGDFRTVRGFTLLAAIIDEAAFFGYDVDTKVKSDTELVRALKPSLATVGGKLIAISSPYSRKGWCYTTHKKHFGNDASKVLVVNCPSRTLNPTLSQKVVDEAMAEDLQAAKSEYGGEFRDDVAEFLPRSVIEQVVIKDRQELLPRDAVRAGLGHKYHAFVDLSGGRKDDGALAIAHRDGRVVVLDMLKRYAPPFNPYDVIGRMAEETKRYGIRRVIGDNYSADFCARAFESNGLRYIKSEKPKAALYAELLPRLCSREIELLDNPHLVNQLASLERRTRSGGRDIIDHPPGGHDDLANVVAGVVDSLTSKVLRIAGAY